MFLKAQLKGMILLQRELFCVIKQIDVKGFIGKICNKFHILHFASLVKNSCDKYWECLFILKHN